MSTASAHARRRRHPATEAGLWLVWITARVTGLAALTRTARAYLAPLEALLHAIPLRAAAVAAASWCRRHGRALVIAGSAAGHRVLLRVELAAADLFTGPVPELLDVAAPRLRRRAAWLALAGGLLVNLLYLAIR
jgi:hypothetical protein